jgi:CheY-like chemotaxis protein/HPt (histidine-containing phosphotransfer) domain-containing protein
VSNAIKFTASGLVHIRGKVVTRDADQTTLEFSVSDTGIGIPIEKQDRLFKPFTQVDASTTREFGGTGLGLSIVRSLAEAMEGDVGFSSEVGKGSTFWFRVRVRNAETVIDAGARSEVSRHTGKVITPTKSKSQFRILAVDDNEANRKVLHAIFKKLGIQSQFSEDGQQAVDAVTIGAVPDLVIMDCQMPVMDGFEATRRIRAWEAEQSDVHIPIVALTAGAFEEDRRNCIEAGMNDFLAKPIDVRKLQKMLGKWLPVESSDTAISAKVSASIDSAQSDQPASLFDRVIFLDQLDGNTALAAIVIESAMADAESLLDQMEQAIASENWSDAKRITHTMKGLMAQLGGMELSGQFSALNKQLKAGKTVEASVLPALREDYHTLIECLTEFLPS